MEDDSERSHDSVALWSPAVEEIERAVNDLRHEQRETIKAIYLEPEATMEQAAKRIGCDVRTLRRRRDAAQKRIELILESNKTFLQELDNKTCKGVRLLENAI
jgi:DNA-directed RNA polymerase specialized sigma24 family protein